MRKLFYSLAFLFLPFVYCTAQTDSIRHRIFLIGDAGDLYNNGHPVIDWLTDNVDWNDEKNSAIFLGDNVYYYGLPMEGESNYAYYKGVLDYQMKLVKGKKAKAYFIMGNHDWKAGKIGGWEQAVNQIDYINGQLQPNIQAFFTNGCPGPEAIELDTLVVLGLMDSQWFLQTHAKPGVGSSCVAKTIDEFSTELEEIVSTHPNQLLIMAMHHPIHTHGVHGGATFKLKHHIFPLAEAVKGLYIPLPILGSVYPVARGIFGNIQDVNHPLYRAMARTVEEVIKKHPNVVTVAGHDHSLQLLQHDSLYQIVSGSGAKLSALSTSSHNKDLIYGQREHGFSVLEVTQSGKVTTKFYTVASKGYTEPSFTRELFTLRKAAPITAAKLDTLAQLPDSITVIANSALEGNGFKRMLIGANYREEWTAPIKVPILDVGKEEGGFRPLRKGGGKQTRSLRIEDSTGKEWALRSIEKFPEAAIPADLRQGFTKDVVEDGISASYPYGSLSIAPLAKAAGLPIIRRKLVYIPDDPRLDRFRTDFSNTLAVLEEREPLGVKKTDNTEEVILKLAKDNDDHIDQESVLKARLLDNFIMDFDRHEDQWRWAARDTGKGKIYYAITRDHDQAFFVSEGLIPLFAAKPWFVPEIQGFRAKAKNIKTFNRPARNFDRFFMTELDEKDWQQHIDTFLNAMTDEVIENALRQQPREVQQYNMGEIINKLKQRRTYFRDEMLEYYRFLSKTVSVVGSNQKEQFLVSKKEDGSMQVVVNKIDKAGALSSTIYDRTFDPKITKEVRIYGLGDEDRYIVEGDRSPIKVRIVGGSGNDTFINNGKGGHIVVYDAAYEKNTISGNPGLFNRISNDPQANRFDRLSYKYNYMNPGLAFAYNVDDGLFLGAQLEVVRQGFRKEPYGMRQFFSGARAFKTGALRFRYEGDWIKTFGYHDLLIRADIRAPVNITNFFGLGNETIFDESKPGSEQYYRIRYDFVDVSALFRRQLQSWMRVNYGLTYQYFRIEEKENKGKYVSETATNGLNPETLYKGKMFAGGHFKLDINSRNNSVMPTRGFVMDMNIRPIVGIKGTGTALLQTDIDMRVFASLFSLPRIVLASRFGWGRNFGRYEIPQAYYLGGIDNLRGYRRDRFAGRAHMFNNTEVRFKIADFSTYLFPGSFGVLVFNDFGRVWEKGEKSTDWKVGNGVGIWLAPIKRFVIAAHLARSKEEKAMPLITFGFQF